MRIEGTYTFPGAIDRVFMALTDAEQLRHILPGCERLIQLGPAEPDGAISFEARIQCAPDGKPVTMTATAVAARRPAHLRLGLRGRTPRGHLAGSGLIDLVEQDEFTVLAYLWDFDVDAIASEARQPMQEAARQYIRAACEQLAHTLQAEVMSAARAAPGATSDEEGRLDVTTPRGRIVRLPATSRLSPLSLTTGAWVQRVAWMSTGMLIGISAIGLLMGFARWFNEHER